MTKISLPFRVLLLSLLLVSVVTGTSSVCSARAGGRKYEAVSSYNARNYQLCRNVDRNFFFEACERCGLHANGGGYT